MQFSIIPKVQAACNPGSGVDLSECLLLSDSTPVKDRYDNAGFLVNLLVSNAFVFAGLILFGLVIFAGFKLIMGGKKGLDDARSIITTAIAGFIVMLSAYWIVQIIKAVTGADIQL